MYPTTVVAGVAARHTPAPSGPASERRADDAETTHARRGPASTGLDRLAADGPA